MENIQKLIWVGFQHEIFQKPIPFVADTFCRLIPFVTRYLLLPIPFVGDTFCDDTFCADTICDDTFCTRIIKSPIDMGHNEPIKHLTLLSL